TVNAGGGADTFNVTSTSPGVPVVVNGFGGDDVVNVTPLLPGVSSLLGNLAAPVTTNGQTGSNTLNIWDQSNTFGTETDIGAGFVQRPPNKANAGATRFVSFNGFQLTTFNAGTGNDRVFVVGTA